MKHKTLKLFISLLTLIPSLGSAHADEDTSWIQNYLTPVSDFPQPGIQFQWYANLLKDPKAFRSAIQTLAKRYRDSDLNAIIGLDSRGFIFGAALAYELEVPFVMIRKPRKLPRAVERIDYSLEYGKASFEIERAARRNPSPSGEGRASYLSGRDKALVAPLRSGEMRSIRCCDGSTPEGRGHASCRSPSPSFEEGVLQIDSLAPGDQVVIVDDVLATGGTARAAKELVERLEGQVVEAAFLIELPFLHGREKVAAPVYSLTSINNI